MSSDPKDLQRLKEANDGASAMDWSTVSNVHHPAMNSQDLVKQLQTLSAPGGVTPMEWSTVSNVHGGKAAVESQNEVKQLQALSAPGGVTPMEWSTVSNVHGHAA